MSLYGALFASVAGLGSQSNKIGIISDNISNVNTVGYKGGQSEFETLVTNSGIVSAYSPGGVLSLTRQNVTQQGLIQGTSSATDVAISGAGFFVVNTKADGSGSELYTRAGSFTQDSLGNFVNSSGLFLQGWPLDRSGQLPGAPGNTDTNSSTNLSSLQSVNVQQATGNAASTTKVTLSANLQASQAIFPGAAADAKMDKGTVNFGQPGKSIIVPDSVDGIARGDKFLIKTGAGLNYAYSYGGFTFSRNVGNGGSSDSGQAVQSSPLTLGATPFTTTNSNKTVTVAANANGLVNGDVVTISGESASVNGIPASDLNQSFVVSNVTANSFDITVATPATSGGTGGNSGLSVVTRPFAGNILDATTENQTFLGTTGISGFTAAALSFNITTAASGTTTFTYTNATPNAQIGQFNSLSTLADAINAVSGLTARVTNGQLFVGASDANAAVTFTNGSTTGTAGPPVQGGIDWVRELGLNNVTVGDGRFNSLDSLASAVNASPGLHAQVSNDLTNASLSINVQDPLDTISFSDQPISAPLPPYASATPFTTTASSNTVSITSPTPVTFKTGDIVTVDPPQWRITPRLSPPLTRLPPTAIPL
ncbi:MAG: flagellar hook-basal body complex protein [Alphaproteobacteria bacterium]|nr:flagellar hook-basal body complex protein [Alphaproteobacteria bacterium]